MKLAQSTPQKPCKVIRFVPGHRIESKLRQLGILPGSIVKVLRQAPFSGPFMIEVDGRSVALGAGVAELIIVEEQVCE